MLPSAAETNSFLSVFHTALEIRNDIRCTQGFNNCNGINKENAAKMIPESLFLFLRLLFTGAEELPGESTTDTSIHNRVLSISQDIIFAVTNGRKLTPKHVGLGLTVHQATRSKSLVDLLYSAGHCISYDMVLRVDTTLVKKSLDDLKSNMDMNMDMVSLLLQFLRAERTANWKLHLSAFADMLPWFAVYDHTNYTRWGAVYLADMKQLQQTHADVFKEFMDGNFVVKRTDHNFNQISTNQALEHINRVCKVAGGLIGITRSDSARDRWCLTFNKRSKLVEETCAMFGIQTDDPDTSIVNPKETGTAIIARDESDVVKIMHQLQQFGVFSQTEPLLISLASHDVAPHDIGYALMNAKTCGTKKLNTFIKKRLCSNEANFHAVLQKTKSPTLSTMYNQRMDATIADKTKVLKADRNLFQRLLTAQSSGRTINLQELLQHELFPVPLALADTAGNLRSTQKSALAQILEDGVAYDSLPPANGRQTFTIIDGQALVQAIGKSKRAKTFADLADVFVQAVFRYANGNCTRVDVVFDRYDGESIKTGARNKRAGSARRPIRRIIESGDVPLSTNWKQFIDLPENKADLARFLSEQRMQNADTLEAEIVTAGGFSETVGAASTNERDISCLKAAHEEADTRLILHALDASRQNYKRTIVVCRDTDVLVLLLHFQNKLTTEIWFQS